MEKNKFNKILLWGSLLLLIIGIGLPLFWGNYTLAIINIVLSIVWFLLGRYYEEIIYWVRRKL